MYSGTVFDNKKEVSTDPCYTVQELWQDELK